MPSIEAFARCFGIQYVKLAHTRDIEVIVRDLLARSGPVICEVVMDEEQEMLFKQDYIRDEDGTFSPQSLSEMAPFIAECSLV